MAKIKFDQTEQVQRVISAVQDDLLGMVRFDVLTLSKICESPIEVALAATILMMDRVDPFTKGNGIVVAGTREVDDYREDKWLLVPQFQWNEFRIDLALRTPQYRFKMGFYRV